MNGQFFNGGQPFPGGPGGPGGYDTGVSVLAIVLRFTFWVLVLLAIVWIAREILRAVLRHRHPVPPPPNPALAALEMLYATGEVSRTEYLARRADLSGIAPPVPPTA